MVWTSIHRKYEALLQGILETFCKEQRISEEKFMKMLEVSKEKASRREKIMLNVILAQDDYDMFVKVMFQEAKNRHRKDEDEDEDDDVSSVSSKLGERKSTK